MLLKSCPCSKKHVSLHTRNNLVSKISNNVRVRALKFSVLILDNELSTCEPGRGPFGRGHFGPGHFRPGIWGSDIFDRNVSCINACFFINAQTVYIYTFIHTEQSYDWGIMFHKHPL